MSGLVRRLLALAGAVVLVLAGLSAWTGAARAAEPGTISDPTGDAEPAKDVTSLTVSMSGGIVEVRATLAGWDDVVSMGHSVYEGEFDTDGDGTADWAWLEYGTPTVTVLPPRHGGNTACVATLEGDAATRGVSFRVSASCLGSPATLSARVWPSTFGFPAETDTTGWTTAATDISAPQGVPSGSWADPFADSGLDSDMTSYSAASDGRSLVVTAQMASLSGHPAADLKVSLALDLDADGRADCWARQGSGFEWRLLHCSDGSWYELLPFGTGTGRTISISLPLGQLKGAAGVAIKLSVQGDGLADYAPSPESDPQWSPRVLLTTGSGPAPTAAPSPTPTPGPTTTPAPTSAPTPTPTATPSPTPISTPVAQPITPAPRPATLVRGGSVVRVALPDRARATAIAVQFRTRGGWVTTLRGRLDAHGDLDVRLPAALARLAKAGRAIWVVHGHTA